MKRRFIVAGLAVVAMGATLQASVTLTSLTGSPNVPGTATFAVNAASSARELWCAWGDSDKGTSFAAWPNNERVCTVPANATAITSELPPGAKKATVARFFLFPAGQSYAVDYLVTTGSQGFDTGIVPEPSIVVSADVLLNDPLVVQQRAFGTADNALTVASYVNGNGYWAWGFQDTQGNWYSLDVAPDAGRAHTTFDGPNNRITLEVGGKPYKTVTVSTTRTNTGTLTVAFCCGRTSSGYSYFMQDGRFYGGTLSTASAGAHAYVPYVQAGVAGVKDTATDAFIGNAPGTGAFGAGGRKDATGAEAGDLVHLAKLRMGDVWSDAAYLFDFSTDLNGDGAVQKGEIRNALHFGSTNENGSAVNLGHTMYIAPDGCNKLAWKTADIPMPSRGLTHASATYLDFPANVQRSNITNTWRNGFSLPGNFTGEVTVVARVFVRNFKFDNLGNSVSIFLNNGLDWNRAFGSEFGFSGSGQPYSIQGNKTFTASQITLRTNRWYDVAYTLRKIGNGRADATFAVAESCLSGAINTGLVFQVVKQDAGCFTNETRYTEASRAIKVGGEDIGGWHRGGDNSGQGAKGFNGGIQRLAVWRRVLSRDEIGEALVQAPPLFRLGTENGSKDEFGAADETPDAVNAEFDPWYRFRGTLSAAKPEVTINFTLRTDSHLVPYVLRVKAAPGTGNTVLMPYVNGRAIGSKLVVAGGSQRWFVPAGLLASGAATLRLVRTGGTASAISFDVVEMNGSAAIGTANNGNGEFTQEGRTQTWGWAGQWNWRRYMRAVLGGNYASHMRTTSVKFWVPPELAENYSFRYTSKITGQGAGDPAAVAAELGGTPKQWPLAVYMNDQMIFDTLGSPDLTPIDVTFAPGELQPGWNTIRWFAYGPGGSRWVCIDFHKLEVIDRPHATMLLVK